ncbi:MAG: HAMP domain-containing histidine kinase [Lachnospiraceae bacterium]|nr:HAMP domain-containing histidine kinase [Lachnospiraceae bacterium]
MAVVSILVLTTVFVVVYINYKAEYDRINKESSTGKTIVALNEVNQLLENIEAGQSSHDISVVQTKLDTVIDTLRSKNTVTAENNMSFIIIMYVVSLILVLITFVVIYVLILRPFQKLESFAGEIATGNLDKDLKYERVNMFGEFTWAFDHMRREIKKARQCEQEAIENNKTVIATLSHDIKTPIASIRAYSEALSDNMDSTPERRQRYIDVITKKCDEVTKITNDMFIHSLHDLDKLVIKKEDVDIHDVINETVNSMIGDRSDVCLGEIKEATIKNADATRIAQVIENLINNSRKYAKTEISICTKILENGKEYCLIIQDKGPGIAPDDMPFIFQKFYRGKNHGEEPGAGLGLFIVKYIMEQMDGRVNLVNDGGLRCELIFIIS